jgi:hypothetical protein
LVKSDLLINKRTGNHVINITTKVESAGRRAIFLREYFHTRRGSEEGSQRSPSRSEEM